MIAEHRKYGVGLEAPCIYKVKGPIKLDKKLNKLVDRIKTVKIVK